MQKKNSERKVNVAHFIGSLQIGGAENQVTLLVNAMDRLAYNCHVIVMHDEVKGFKKSLHLDVEYYSIDYRKRNAVAALYRLYRYLVNNCIDILHCHMYHAAAKGAIIARLASVPVVVTSEHGMNTWKGWQHHAVEKHIVNRLVSKRIAVSEDIRQRRILKDGVKTKDILVYPNAVNTDVVVKDNAPMPHVIGALGRLIDAKDYPVLIHAVARLVSEGRHVQLQIAGEGELRESLESLIGQLRLDDVVSLIGVQPAQAFMDRVDIFAMSSKREGVPVALLEAMARGFPIAATAVGGIPEILEDGLEGLLCGAEDPSALAANIATLIDNSMLREELGRRAREKVIRQFGIDKVIETWSALYSGLLSE